ncbi:ABC transporter ATP-binding protein [Vibrio mangrovi]|uniref:Maltose/maltodextrin import ATP-binding protein MalK n=1 Tax=Vibrio mangrovi TaxID=474394 RepID=A0A1Y6IVY9_9VIBR|nr:sn-glycerol-3-phosphate ABC transporter ATP-binding protein UgpC [Vibrio mangrovi]MDW6004699.1 sn-glycerol-3-phosphate ABC transporter ATP-binding protein UgpC [Vibrio mangrovi]SMS00990.1 Maltose/maltodextrin import ATP-binding protein MalK [Vibrio mangrovi]
MASIELSNVVKRFGDVKTIHDVNLSIDNGEFVVFVGPSGCGKSTLLRMIAGLEEISEGTIAIKDRVVNDVQPSERGVAMVFQSYALYPHMTVAENMGYSLKVSKTPKPEIEKKVRQVAKALQLEALLDRKPSQLSGGQRQRVAIGRAIVRNPDVFLFDEPLSNLDAELRVEMRLHIAKLHQELRSTMVYVTHDQVEAMTLADKIVVLRSGQVEQVGSPMDLYYYPQNQFVAGFIGSPKMNFIPATVSQWSPDAIHITMGQPEREYVLPVVTTPVQAGELITLGIRPEHLNRESGDLEINFHSEVVERLGSSTYIFGQSLGVDDFKFLSSGDFFIEPYKEMSLFTHFNTIHLFNQQGESIRLTGQEPDIRQVQQA